MSQENMFGRKVYSISKPGELPESGYAASEGIIISDVENGWGKFWTVLVTDGHGAGGTIAVNKGKLLNPYRDTGIGIYLEVVTK